MARPRPFDRRPGGRVLALAGVALIVLGCSGTPPPATSGPGATTGPTTGTSASPASAAPATEAAPTAEPTTAEPTAEPTAAGSLEPGSSVLPSVDTMKIRHTADCAVDYGNGGPGLIKLSWTATGTTGVRISIDPPSPDVAYGYGYADYGAAGTAVVPFACDPPNHDANGDYHLYVVTTIHTTGYASWRFAKVYVVVPAATP
ncbi:MAG TPA: hypothetical protein VNH13_01415 [Candidatus Acidoferrales bacterium]|nr:hypothetical protein [Candidatus Acidoferrales bacterium]